MSDFPRNPAVPTHIHNWTRWSVAPLGARIGAAMSSVGNFTWTANAAIYVPLMLPWHYNVRRMFWLTGTLASAGNTDVGIYTRGGARLFSSGSTANGSTGIVQYVTVSPDVLLEPGAPYFLAFAHDSASGSHQQGSAGTGMTAIPGRTVGLYQQLSAFPLPSPATFAAYAAIGMPMIGITNTDSGF